MKMTVLSHSVARRRVAKGMAACVIGVGVFYAGVAGKNYFSEYYEKQRRIAALEAPIARLIEKDDYDSAWNEMKKTRDSGLLGADIQDLMERANSNIHKRKIARIEREIEGGDHAAAKSMLAAFRSTIPQYEIPDIEEHLSKIDQKNLIAGADKYFYSRFLRTAGGGGLNYHSALDSINKSKDPLVKQRLVYYRLTALDDCFRGCGIPRPGYGDAMPGSERAMPSEDFIIEEVSKLAQYHAGISDEYMKKRYLRGAVGYIGSVEKASKDKAIDAILDKTPVIFTMNENERKEFMDEALAAYLKFFEYVSGNPNSAPSDKLKILQHLLSAGRKHGVDISKQASEIVEKYSPYAKVEK